MAPMVGPHAVVVFDHPEKRVAATLDFIRPVVEGGGSAVVIARGDLRQAVHEAFPGSQGKRVFAVDAEATLALFDKNGLDEVMFRKVIGAMMDAARDAGNGDVVAMGEMVALLAERGRMSAALTLEQFWDNILDGVPLLCSYPSRLFRGEGKQPLARVFGAHSHFDILAEGEPQPMASFLSGATGRFAYPA